MAFVSGLWLSQESVGDAGVNHLGYFTSVWSPRGDTILTHGYTGSMHAWRRAADGSLVPKVWYFLSDCLSFHVLKK